MPGYSRGRTDPPQCSMNCGTRRALTGLLHHSHHSLRLRLSSERQQESFTSSRSSQDKLNLLRPNPQRLSTMTDNPTSHTPHPPPSTATQPQLSPVEHAKRQAAYRAVAEHFNPSAQYIGIGSGSTVVYVVEAIAAKGPEVTSQMVFVPTGFQSRELIVEAGLPLGAIDSLVPFEATQLKVGKGAKGAVRVATGLRDGGLDGERVMLDVVFDGADEVDEELNCIKGGGACLFQEKLVAISARKFVCVADFRKFQPRLLTRWPAVPIEIVPPAAPTVLRCLRGLGSSNPFIRLGGSAKAGPVVTDNGNFIIDAPFPKLLTRADVQGGRDGSGKDGQWEGETLAKRLKEIVGVVETGLFWGRNGQEPGGDEGGQKPVAAYFGMEGGEVVVRTAGDTNPQGAR